MLYKAICSTLLGALGLGLIGAIAESKAYWGYYFQRPPVLPETTAIVRVEHLTPVMTPPCDAPETCTWVVDPSASLATAWQQAQRNTYSTPEGRLLLALQAADRLPSRYSQDFRNGDQLYQALLRSPIIAQPEPGYTTAHWLEGIVLQGVTATGERQIIVGARGQQAANDHYPYYEAVFVPDGSGDTFSYVRGQVFFYDIAGLEGFEWYVMWPFFSLFAMAIGLPLTVIGVKSYQIWQGRSRTR